MKFGIVQSHGNLYAILFYSDLLPIKISHFLFHYSTRIFPMEYGESLLEELLRKIENFIRGILSGIPVCCVWEYVLEKRSYNWAGVPNWLQYVPCEKCLKTRNFAHKPFSVYMFKPDLKK